MENPDLDIYQVSESNNHNYTESQSARVLIIFEILISVFEKAYIMFRDKSTKIKKSKWIRWNEYMIEWMKRENFRQAWQYIGNQWDTGFEMHMNKLHDRVKTQDRYHRAGIRA
jgi:hypothetical protein